jgi:hypothetical protein
MEVICLLFQGRELPFLTLVLLFAVTVYLIRKGGPVPAIRKIAGLEAVDEAIGRATEMGKPVFFTPGGGDVSSGASAVDTMAAIEVLSHVARLAARYKLSLTVGVREPSTHVIADQTVREAYVAAGQAELYNPNQVQFYSPEQFAYAASCVGFFHREHPAAIFLLGFFQAEALMLSEGAAQSGGIVIGGMVRFNQLPTMVAACDYTLIAEELFVSGAYLSKNATKLSCVRAQDFGKVAALVLIGLGALMATLGDKTLATLFK